jgi:prepilin-type N-terminal cleavage/methylation domain-containing protein
MSPIWVISSESLGKPWRSPIDGYTVFIAGLVLVLLKISGVFSFLRRKLKMLNRTRKAFTLLELLVAFIIMAILAAVSVPSLLGLVTGSHTNANETSITALADAPYYTAYATDAIPSYAAVGTVTAGVLTATATFPGGQTCTINVSTIAGGDAPSGASCS